jgi:hypothetical protein
MRLSCALLVHALTDLIRIAFDSILNRCATQVDHMRTITSKTKCYIRNRGFVQWVLYNYNFEPESLS